jgi:hypothetical protein
MLPILTKIKAVREDSSAPLLECYAETPETVARIFAGAATSTNNQRPKEGPKQMQNMTGYNPLLANAKEEKNHVAGIGASNDPARLLDVLDRLGVGPSDDMMTSLKTLSAHGKPIGEHFQVSVVKLDQALRKTEATLEQRLAYKASLHAAGLLMVPR